MKSSGTIRYSPKTLGVYSHWWMVLDCDPELGKYIRHLYHIEHYRCRKLSRPAWKEHITVIRNEVSSNGRWGIHNGERVDFSYSWLKTNGYCWWLPVQCEFLLDLRKQLGLGDPEVPLHLSVGYEA